MGFPGGSDGKVSDCNVGDMGLNPGLGRCPGEENSGLENSIDCVVHKVTKRQTRLSDLHFDFFKICTVE